MESDLRRILRKNARALADELAGQLTSRSISRYREMDARVLSVRCRLLTEALVRSAQEGWEHLGEFVASIAGGRVADGFELEDLQTTLRILEVRVWLIVANESTPDSLRASLTALNTMFGYARDELARAFRARAYATTPSTRLARLEVTELFRGTDSALLTSSCCQAQGQ
jgi:hypothetical protein